MEGEKAALAVADPPYNVGPDTAPHRTVPKTRLADYLQFSQSWTENIERLLRDDSHLYIWMGADYRRDFQPLPDFLIMMRSRPTLKPRNWITVRNQRGYGSQKNWMWVRQELLHYVKGNPYFRPVYTEIPKILKGYYKVVGGKRTENLQRSRSPHLRPGNVWVDIQQVFYRMEENVPGCYAQKPLSAVHRIILSSSRPGDLVVDCFAHSGTTLLSGERHGRRVYTFDIDPVYAEISIRRLLRFRATGKTGWQREDPFNEDGAQKCLDFDSP
jgi:DNA modification methylase